MYIVVDGKDEKLFAVEAIANQYAEELARDTHSVVKVYSKDGLVNVFDSNGKIRRKKKCIIRDNLMNF